MRPTLPWSGVDLYVVLVHGKNITHRDIKLANTLVKAGHIYLADFDKAILLIR